MKKTKIIISVLVAASIFISGCSFNSAAKLGTTTPTNTNNKVAENVKDSSKIDKQSTSTNNKDVQAKQDNAEKQSSAEKNQNTNTNANTNANAKTNTNTNVTKAADTGAQTPAKVERVIPKPPSQNKAKENIQVNSNVKQVQVANNTQPTSSTQSTNNVQATNNPTAATQNTTSTNTASNNGTGGTSSNGLPAYNYVVSNYNEYYNVIYNSLKNFDEKIYIKLNNYDSKTYNLNVINKVLQDYYDIDYGFSSADGTLYSMGNEYILNINYKYNLPKSTMTSMRDQVQSKAQSIISQIINSGMNNVQKELAIHDYIVNNTVYDYDDYVNGTLPQDVFTDYGVLIKGKAVCEGYAKAMQRLLRMCGIESKAVVGQASGVAHAWNLVNINGVYTHVDATWDDPVTQSRQNILTHDYFNISDAQIAADHQWDRSQYPAGVQVK